MKPKARKNVYMDYASQAPLPEKVKEAIAQACDICAHPLSPHSEAALAAAILDKARNLVAELVSASPNEVILTSGGTESNNAAVFGLAAANERKGRHIVVSAIEHLSVIDAVERLVRKGYEKSVVPVDKFGTIDPEDVKRAIRPDTSLVCMTLASDELGTIEPISAIARICKDSKVILHVDAVQAAGHVPINFNEWGIDSMSISGQPMFAPGGIGALVISGGVRFVPYIIGGGGEDGRRGGTPNIVGAAGLAAAAELCVERMDEIEPRIAKLRDRLVTGVLREIPESRLIGHPVTRLPGHAAFVITGAEGEAVVRELDMVGVKASTGSLCSRWAMKPSHVLSAIGVYPDSARETVLFTLGEGNTEEEFEFVIRALPGLVSKVRSLT